MGWALALQRANHDALDEVLLNEGVHHQDGQRGHHGHSGLDGFAGLLGTDFLTELGHHLVGAFQHDAAQRHLQPLLLGLGDVNHGVEPGVPVTNGGPQTDGGDDGHGQGQNHPSENLQTVATKTLRRLKDELDAMTPPEIPEEVAATAKMTAEDVSQVVTAARPHNLRHNSGIVVDDAEGCAVKFAKCCNPLPGDNIIGFITKGYGVSVHKRDCPNVVDGLNKPENEGRWITAEWERGANLAGKDLYEAHLQIHAENRIGMLASVTTALAEMRVSILQDNCAYRADDTATISMKVSCKNTEHYESIVSRLRNLEGVLDVMRGFAN